MCGCESYDGPSVYHQALVKARRERKCEECSARIAPGQFYSRAKGCWDGEWNTYSECVKCFALRQAWHDTEGCWPSHGNLRDDVLECLREGRRWPPDGDYDDRETIGPPDPICMKFGMNYRRHLGRMGPRRAS